MFFDIAVRIFSWIIPDHENFTTRNIIARKFYNTKISQCDLLGTGSCQLVPWVSHIWTLGQSGQFSAQGWRKLGVPYRRKTSLSPIALCFAELEPCSLVTSSLCPCAELYEDIGCRVRRPRLWLDCLQVVGRLGNNPTVVTQIVVNGWFMQRRSLVPYRCGSFCTKVVTIQQVLYHGCYNQVAHFKVDKPLIYLSTNLSTS